MWDTNWLEEIKKQPIPDCGLSFVHARFMPDVLLHHPIEYRNETEIRVSCTQQDNQTKLVRAWAQALPLFNGLKKIHFCTRFPESLVEPIAKMEWLESLHIHWSGLKSIAPWSGLPKLREFHLGSSPSLSDPHVALTWPMLERLSFENVRANQELDWVPALKSLRELLLVGSIWSVQKLRTLSPISSLERLERVSFVGARVKEKESLFELASIKSLKAIDSSYWWPKGWLERFAESRPDVWVNGMKWPNYERPVCMRFEKTR